MATIFSKIVVGEIPCHKVAENDNFLAFLDIQPIRMGHVLVIPKKETDYLFDLDDKELGELMVFAKTVAKAVKQVYPCKKVGVTVIGLEVPHAHVHLLPMNQLHDMDFTKEKMKPSAQELAESARLLSEAFMR